MEMKKKGIRCIIILLVMYVLSVIILAVCAAILLRTDAGASFVSGSVVATYAVSSIAGGFLMGQNMGKHKFLWGLVTGVIYFLILIGAGRIVYHSSLLGGVHVVTCLLICGVGGMLGGMLAPRTVK